MNGGETSLKVTTIRLQLEGDTWLDFDMHVSKSFAVVSARKDLLMCINLPNSSYLKGLKYANVNSPMGC